MRKLSNTGQLRQIVVRHVQLFQSGNGGEGGHGGQLIVGHIQINQLLEAGQRQQVFQCVARLGRQLARGKEIAAVALSVVAMVIVALVP